jgi:ribonuclease HI
VRQIKGEYKVKDPGLKPLWSEVRKALTDFDSWSIRHVRREDNEAADLLVNETLDA